MPTSTDLLLFTVYTVALILIVSVVMRVFFPARTVVIREEPEVVVGGWWPWNITRYNAWPYWSGWWSGGSDGGYSGRVWTGPGHLHPPVHHRPDSPLRPWGSGGRGANAGAPSSTGGAARGGHH